MKRVCFGLILRQKMRHFRRKRQIKTAKGDLSSLRHSLLARPIAQSVGPLTANDGRDAVGDCRRPLDAKHRGQQRAGGLAVQKFNQGAERRDVSNQAVRASVPCRTFDAPDCGGIVALHVQILRTMR